MLNTMKKGILLLLLFIAVVSCKNDKNRLDLSGSWTVKLDSLDVGFAEQWPGNLFTDTIQLPGTTDEAGMGVADTLKPELTKPQLLHLRRHHSYVGPAWYAREVEIPAGWEGKELSLNLERVIWNTQVWVDGTRVDGEGESLIAPHRFNLTPYLTPGKKHIVTLRVDNRRRYNISVEDQLLAHAYTDHTQTIWNGVIGKIEIEASDKININLVKITPDIDTRSILAQVKVINNTGAVSDGELVLRVASKNGKTTFDKVSQKVTLSPGENSVDIVLPMGEKAVCWNEFSPEVYTLKTQLKAGACKSENTSDFGMRKIGRDGSMLTINDRPLFLRGTLECAIFPLTGRPPMTTGEWRKIFTSAQEWGLNHLRFHSWCPPKAAFEVADEMGFYLQVELPVWSVSIKEDDENVRFLRAEAQRIIDEYGNHPSFCFWSLGNELQSNFDVLTDVLLEIKAKDNRHLYTTTSFTFENGHGVWPEADDDFFITQWTKKGWVRGQGVFNSYPPQFNQDYTAAVDSMTVPLITHEIGQYSVYPNMAEIEKYTGVLKPLNFMAVREDLKRKGMLEKAPLYTLASGKLAAVLYKEEIERAMKTTGISGYQLLDLHDFPGQGTALVGLLDAFWDSKGLISSEEFRQFTAPIVPLLRYPKATYFNNETFTADIEITNYSETEPADQEILWTVTDGSRPVANGSSVAKQLKWGNNLKIASLNLPLKDIKTAAKLTVNVAIKGTPYKNNWNFWVYPADQPVEMKTVKYTRSLAEAQTLLAAGEKVLFNPDWRTMKGIEGKFVPVFWSPVHFPKQAGTMGLLCDPTHPALKQFPTDIHSDWQWWDLNINSTTLIIDSLRGVTPIIEMIDNFANNRKLASLMEGKVGSGKFVLATFDLSNDLEKRPVARQMLISLLNYMNSADFNPETDSDIAALKESIGVISGKGGKESATSIY